ncbi:MAG: rod shape-determining protein MreD [Lachnospiraceae bacterium]|nr:rod shape-determining protein MreD [Lachnospiraceae bacterium]
MIRVVSYIAIIFISFVLQTSVFPMMTFLQSTPNIMLILTFTFAILRGREEGLIVGVICGLLMDFGSGGLIGFYGLFYMFVGYLLGFLSQHINEDTPIVPIVLAVVCEMLFHFYVFMFRYLLRGRLGFGTYFNNIMLAEIIITTVLALFIYGLLLLGNDKLEAYEQRSALKFA